jgi:hypothetical protein
MSDTRMGIVVNARNEWPELSEIQALGTSWMRSIVYSFDQFEEVLAAQPQGVGVIALLNSETENVGRDLAGWADAVRTFAQRFAGKVQAVECLNEWDQLGISPETAVECVRVAAPILHGAGIKCLLGSVSGPNWQNALDRAIQLASSGNRVALDGVCFHPYAQRALNFPAGYGFGEIDAVVQRAHEIAGLPVWVTEYGIKLGLAGGETGQAEYVRRSILALSQLSPDVLAAACYFCWNDRIGAPEERGDQALGLRGEDNAARPAWQAFVDAVGAIAAAARPPTGGTTPHEGGGGPPTPAQPTPDEAFAQAKQDVFGAATRVGPEAVFMAGTALSDYWALHIAELGPACGPERYGYRWDAQENDWVVQAVFQGFSTGVYKWTPGNPVVKAA